MSNSVGSDQMPYFVASNLGLHCFLRFVRPNTLSRCGNQLTLVLLNKLRCQATSNFQPIRLLELYCCYKFTNLMANSADPDQLASEEAN